MTDQRRGLRAMINRIRFEWWAWKEAKKIESDDYELDGEIILPRELAGRRIVNGVIQPQKEAD